jgi:hypothetical protein
VVLGSVLLHHGNRLIDIGDTVDEGKPGYGQF